MVSDAEILLLKQKIDAMDEKFAGLMLIIKDLIASNEENAQNIHRINLVFEQTINELKDALEPEYTEYVEEP
jgi:hypothetical protein